MSTSKVINFANKSGMTSIGFHLHCETPSGKKAKRWMPAFWQEFHDAGFRTDNFLRQKFVDLLNDFRKEARKLTDKLEMQGYKNFQIQVGSLRPNSDDKDSFVEFSTLDEYLVVLAIKAFHLHNDRMVNDHAQRHFKREAFHDSYVYSYRIVASAEEILTASEKGERVCSLKHPEYHYRLLNNRVHQWTTDWRYVGAVDIPVMFKVWEALAYDKFLEDLQLIQRYPVKSISLGYSASSDLKQVRLAVAA